MAKARKTIEVSNLLAMANNYLLNSKDDLSGERLGVANYITSVLIQTDNYKGFKYLDAKDMESSFLGKSIGIIFDESGNTEHVYPDKSRVRFY